MYQEEVLYVHHSSPFELLKLVNYISQKNMMELTLNHLISAVAGVRHFESLAFVSNLSLGYYC